MHVKPIKLARGSCLRQYNAFYVYTYDDDDTWDQ